MELFKTAEFLVIIRISERINEERWRHKSWGEIRNSRNRAFSTSRCRKYCNNGVQFSIFERGENPLFDSCALLASLRREPSIRLNIMYYERRRHYNPILNVKVSADSRGGYYIACNMGLIKIEVTTAWKNAHAVTPFCRANPPTRAQLGAKRVSYVL